MCMSTFSVYMSAYHVHAWCLRNSEKVSDLLGLELQMIVSLHVDVGKQTQVH